MPLTHAESSQRSCRPAARSPVGCRGKLLSHALHPLTAARSRDRKTFRCTFPTCCSHGPAPGSLRSAVAMPDHIHLIVDLGAGMNLSEAVRRFKGRSAADLRTAGLKWPRGYFDHRMRTKEDLLPAFLYLFLNPYRAGLITARASWPFYYCSPDDWTWLGGLTQTSCPQPE